MKCEYCGEGYCDKLYYECPHCCDHEPDMDEGGHCGICGKELDMGSLIDDSMDRTQDR